MAKKKFTKQSIKDFEIKITDVTPINPQFSKCKIYVLYTGKNRNYTIFQKDVVENALYTLKNCPIIGEFSETLEDFKGHGGKVEISDEGIKYIDTTKPYGVVPESVEFSWETLLEEDGTEHEYLVADGCLLWTGRYPEATKVVENGTGQSMEVNISDGNYTDDDYLNITDFVFSALCLLGQEVEPCFEQAKATAYTLNKDEFNKEFNEMLDEIKKFTKKEPESNKELGDDNNDSDDNNKEPNNEQFTLDNFMNILSEGWITFDDATKKTLSEVVAGENINDKKISELENQIEKFNLTISEKDTAIFAKEEIIKELNIKIGELDDYCKRVDEELIKLKAEKEKFEQAKIREEKEGLFEEFKLALTEDEIKPIYNEIDNFTKEQVFEKLNYTLSQKVLSNLKENEETEEIKLGLPKKDKSKNKFAL